MRIVGLGVYSATYAGTRLRFTEFIPALEVLGHRVDYYSFVPARLESVWARGSVTSRMAILIVAVLVSTVRILRLLGRPPDVILVRKEVFPLGVAWPERVLARRVPIVWDVDDAVWEGRPSRMAPWLPRAVRRSERKFRQIAERAAAIVAGSEGAASWGRTHCPRVVTIPTCVSPVPSEGVGPHERDPRRLCWIGAPATTHYLASLLSDGFGDCARRQGCHITAVGADPDLLAKSSDIVTVLPWSVQTEMDVLLSSGLGVYPVIDTESYANAKAGLKAVLYMSSGLPQIATSTAINMRMIPDSAGYLVDNSAGFCYALEEHLAKAPHERVKMSREARRTAAGYSHAAWVPRLARELEYAAQIDL